MNVPIEISFRDVPPTPQIEALIRRKADQLEKVSGGRLSSCRVAVEMPQRAQRTGNPYRVRINMTMPPGHELAVSREPQDSAHHDDLETVIVSAFKAARRQLKELAARQRRDVKTHEVPSAFVVRLFEEDGYGFLKTPDGRDLYFHRNSVLHGDWDRIEVGTEVRFEEELGEKGPQATTVQIVSKPGIRHAKVGGHEEEPPSGWEDR